jgi:alpha-beta hydrolase superfamily lysophospholipase
MSDNIFIKTKKVQNEKGCIFIFHGLGEHVERYTKFMDFINKRGYSAIAPDLPGFGKSYGKRGHIKSFEVYYKLMEDIIEKNNSKIKIVMGHSMGGLIASRFVEVTKHNITALIISGAATKLKEIPLGLKLVTKILDTVSPSITFSNRINIEDLSYNSESNNAYANDPLVHDKISARLFWEMKRESKKLYSNIEKIKIPTLIIHGKNDPLVPPKFSQDFFDSLNIQKKKLKFIENAKHESMNEKDGLKVFEIISEFLNGLENES